jgi:RNA polymerase sigma-70 factor, ECF subfamily
MIKTAPERDTPTPPMSDPDAILHLPLVERTFAPRGRAENARLRRMVDQHWQVVGRLLRHLGVPQSDVDDGIQHVFLVAAEKLEAIRPDAERAFLLRTAVNIAARVRREKARSGSREVMTGLAEDAADTQKGADELLDESAALRTLDRILSRMDEDVREVFVLYEVEELTMAKISELLEVPPGTVASRLRRGRETFRAEIARDAERSPR